MEGDPGRAGACATRAGAGQARSSPLVGSSTGPLNGPGPVCCTSRAALCALGGCARARPEGESRSGCAKMRAPRRRTLRKGGRRAEAPFQGASAALAMATLAGAACVGRHELPCRHTAREFCVQPESTLSKDQRPTACCDRMLRSPRTSTSERGRAHPRRFASQRSGMGARLPGAVPPNRSARTIASRSRAIAPPVPVTSAEPARRAPVPRAARHLRGHLRLAA